MTEEGLRLFCGIGMASICFWPCFSKVFVHFYKLKVGEVVCANRQLPLPRSRPTNILWLDVVWWAGAGGGRPLHIHSSSPVLQPQLTNSNPKDILSRSALHPHSCLSSASASNRASTCRGYNVPAGPQVIRCNWGVVPLLTAVPIRI